MFAWLVSWVRNHGEHHGCSSEVDVWVSGGLDTQNMKGIELDLSVWLLRSTSSSIVIFVLGMPNWVVIMVEIERDW